MRDTILENPSDRHRPGFVTVWESKAGRADALWAKFGDDTIKCMQDGTHLLAVLWESAWTTGDGDCEPRRDADPDRR